MNEQTVIALLSAHYGIKAQSAELLRTGGNLTFRAKCKSGDIFLKGIRAPFFATARQSLAIQGYLRAQGFPMIPILHARDGAPCAQIGDGGEELLTVAYPFLPGGEPDEEDTARVGELVRALHNVMRGYPGALCKRGKAFFIDRYISILEKAEYPQTDWYRAHGDRLFARVSALETGYCHGDLYRGNVLKDANGTLYIVDFDTSCHAFPLYDAALYCNDTDYFHFCADGDARTRARFARFLPGADARTENAVHDLIAISHYQIQATITELYGLNPDPFRFFDAQRDWLARWEDARA